MSKNLTSVVLRELEERARTAAHQAYAPYSRFTVGAAVLCADGKIFSGSNVENASTGLTICAERAAVFAAVGAGARQLEAIVIYTPTPQPTAPCGACRQVLLEFGPDLTIISICASEERRRYQLSDLLPHSFGPENL